MTIGIETNITSGDEEWTIDGFIAEGGFGKIFHATRLKPTPGEAAVKIPAPHIQNDPIWSKKFAREARILANLSHPNVVKVLAFWKFKTGEMALVQEFVKDRQTLAQHFADPANDRVTALLQSLYGLRAIHGTEDNGVVHRDVAPQNILIDGNGNVKIIDFGLAKEDPRVTKPLTVTGAWFGTPGCMAPEQCKDAGRVDRRADFYALGKTFAAALQQRSPHHVEIDRLPPLWRQICRALCAYEVENRPTDADAAISLVMTATSAAGETPLDLIVHAREEEKTGFSGDGWPEFCATYFRLSVERGVITKNDIKAAAKLSKEIFAFENFDGDGLFDVIEDGSLGEHFSAGQSSFEGVDPFGVYLAGTYPYLSDKNQIRCFRRLVRSAIDYHRYPVMARVRAVYRDETREPMKKRLLAVLCAEDPDEVIEGRGVIPRDELVSGAA